MIRFIVHFIFRHYILAVCDRWGLNINFVFLWAVIKTVDILGWPFHRSDCRSSISSVHTESYSHQSLEILPQQPY